MKISSVLDFLYYLAFNSKKMLYELSILKRQQVDVPVISIGNITAGGTGKTPAVINLYQALRPFFKKTGILSRGYKSPYTGYLNLYCDGARSLLGADHSGDEPALIWKKLGNYPGVSGKNRARSAKYLVKKLGVEALILDDAFQYWKFERDLNIVLIDKCNPFGGCRLLPKGRLREHFSNIKRADMVIVTRANHESEYTYEQICGVVKRFNPSAVCASSCNLPGQYWLYKESSFIEKPLLNRPVHAFCGLGNPNNFFADLENAGAKIIGKSVFSDHYEYTEKDVRKISEITDPDIYKVTTLKDWVKIERFTESFQNSNFGYYDLKTSFPVKEVIELMKSKGLIL